MHCLAPTAIMLWPVFALSILVNAAVGHKLSHYIIGGRDANISEVPYMLSFEENGRPECGAAIIGDEWVLSAAHCRVSDHDKGLFRAGSEIKGYGGVIHEILEEVVHPDFNSLRALNDFALYRVYPKFALTNKVAKVKLPEANDDVQVGANAIFSGWGHTNHHNNASDKWQLQAVNRTVTCPEVCLLEYGTRHNLNGTVCLKAAKGVTNCEGDEGGPLVVNGVLVGIATWQTATCRGEGKATIFEKVAPVRKWIKQVTKV